MSLIGNITIGMSVQTAKFASGLKSAQGMLGKFGASLTSTQNLFTGFAAAVGAGVAAKGFYDLVTAQGDFIDKTGDMADRIGISTKSLTQLQHATQLTGSEAEGLGDALLKMNVNLGRAAVDKTGATADAIKMLGLDVQTLAAQDPGETFKQIAQGISQIDTPTGKAAAAMDIFGKKGATLLNTLNAGRGKLDDLAKEADVLGISFNNIDKEKIGAAIDQLDKAGGIVKGVGNAFAIELAPYVEQITKDFVNWIKEAGGLQRVVHDIVKTAKDVVGVFSDIGQVISGVFKGVQAAITSAISTGLQTIKYLFKAIDSIKDTGVSSMLETMQEELDRTAGEKWDAAKERFTAPWNSKGINDWFANVDYKSNQAAAALGQPTSKLGTLSDAQVEAAEAGQEYIEKLQEEITKLKGAGQSSERMKLSMMGVTQVTIRQAGALEKEIEGLKAKADAQKKISEANAKAKQMQSDLQTQIKTFGQTSEQVDAYKLAMAGANKETLAHVEALRKQLDQLKKQKELQEKIKDQRKEVLDSIKTPAQRFADEKKRLEGLGLKPDELKKALANAFKDINSEGMAIMEKYKSPTQKFEEEYKHLEEMLDQGQITKEAFKSEVKEKFRELPNPNDHSKFSSATEFGSSEARSTILKHAFGGDAKVHSEEKQQVTLDQLLYWTRRFAQKMDNLAVASIK